MKKFFAVLVALAAGTLLPVSVLAAFMPGSYTAKLNLNIRSLPSVSGALIGHFNQGDAVQVTQVLGSWCKVDYKYRNAYVYCPYLVPSGEIHFLPVSGTAASTTSTAAVTNGLVTKSLQDTQHWLLTDNEGTDYINNSYFDSRDKALTWDGEARIADFYFQWPLLTDSKCSLTFSGPFHSTEIFKSKCFDNAGMIATSQDTVTSPQQPYDLPRLPFKGFVANLLADKGLMASLDNYFASAQNVEGLFRLYKDAAGILRWEGKFIDQRSGYFMIVSTDAMQTNAAFQTKTGMFQ